MKLIVGSKNPSKIQAIENASKKCIYFKDQEIFIEWQEVASWISDMPLSLEETLEWARNRAKNLYTQSEKADFYIWIEWWVSIIESRTFLTSVVCIINNIWELHYGISPLQEAPLTWSQELHTWRISLGDLTDRETKRLHTGKQEWSTWILSDMMMTRSGNFELAFFCAISPFYNQYYK